jgi:hypothetical protein
MSIEDIKIGEWMFGLDGRSFSKAPVGDASPLSGAWLTLGNHDRKSALRVTLLHAETDFGIKPHLCRPSPRLQFPRLKRWVGQVAVRYFPAQTVSIALALAQIVISYFHLHASINF